VKVSGKLILKNFFLGEKVTSNARCALTEEELNKNRQKRDPFSTSSQFLQ